jgi:predicted RNA-binding protein
MQEMISRIKGLKISLGAIKVDREKQRTLLISKKGKFKLELARL